MINILDSSSSLIETLFRSITLIDLILVGIFLVGAILHMRRKK